MLPRVLTLSVLIGCGRYGFDVVDTRPRTPLALDRVVPAEPLVDFPLPIVLDDSRADRTELRGDASDLRVTDTNGSNLAIEIEQPGAFGGAPTVAWVRVPRIASAPQILYASFGNDGAAPNDVWTVDYEAVWHLGDLQDSTGHGHDGVATGTSVVPGVVGSGRTFASAALNTITVADDATLGFASFTVSGWINVQSMTSTFSVLIARELEDLAADDFFLGLRLGALRSSVRTTGGPITSDGGAVSQHVWHHLALSFEPTLMRSYLDGVEGSTPAAPGEAVHTMANPIFLGANRNNVDGTAMKTVADNAFLDGMLDEVRLERIARPAAWVAYDVAAALDQVISYRPIER